MRSISHGGLSIKYVTLFLASFDPPPLSHFFTHPGPPKSTSHISDPLPIFSSCSTKIPDKSPLYKFHLNCSRRFLSGVFCPGWFLSVLPSVTISGGDLAPNFGGREIFVAAQDF